MAGCVSCRFPKKKKKEKTKTQEEAAEELLKSLENGEDMSSEENQEAADEMLGSDKPIIKVRAIDFPMLLHELVKGVMEMIVDTAMPRSKSLATEVHRQTSSFADEAEDFRYGPYLAADLNSFIMKSPNVEKYPNIKEFVFGKLIDTDRWSDEDCLENLKNVFLESPRGRKLIDDLVNETIEDLDAYEQSVRDWENEQKEREEETKYRQEEETPELDKEEESDIDKLVKQSLYGGGEETKTEIDYSELTPRELTELIDDALDRGDFDEVRKLSQYMKEGKEIYLKELERINESQINHNRRK